MKLTPGRHVWDAIVVGGGPSGAVAAYTLARAGFDTLLVERYRFPRFKVCGGCISARAVEQLRAAGLGTATAALPAVPLNGLKVGNGRGPAIDIPLPGGLSISRAAFDGALSAAAMDAGACVRFGVQARLLEVESATASTRSVEMRTGGAGVSTAQARVVIAADGLAHPSLAELAAFRSKVARRSHIGAGAVLDEPEPEYPRGTIHMAVGRAGYVGLVRIENGGLNVAAAVDPGVVANAGGIAPALTSILNEAEFPVPRRVGSVRWRGTPRLTRTSSRTASHRVLLVGDSAAYVEPFTGEGISWALSDATSVGAYVERGIGRWSAGIEHDWMSTHRRLIAGERRLSQVARAVLRSGSAVSIGLGVVRRFPALAAPAIRLACSRSTGWTDELPN